MCRVKILIYAFAVILGGCGEEPPGGGGSGGGTGGAGGGPPPGTGRVTLQLEPTPPQSQSSGGSTVTAMSASISGESAHLYGDVSSAYTRLGSVDLFGTTAQSVVFDQLPIGLYSRVSFEVEGLSITGTALGPDQITRPLQVHFSDDVAQVDLRDTTGLSVDPDHPGMLEVAIDASGWLSEIIFDASLDDGTGHIVIDRLHTTNPAVLAAYNKIRSHVGPSISLKPRQ